MRIGVLTHNYPKDAKDRQNAGIFVYDLAHAIKRQGHEVFVLCPAGGGEASIDSVPVTWFDWASKGKDLGGLQPLNPYHVFLFFNFLFSGIKATTAFCKKNRVDFTIAMWAFPSGFFALWAKKRIGIPYCVWALGSDIYVYARYPIISNVVKMVLRNAKVLLADGIDLARRVRGLSGRHCGFLPSASYLPTRARPREKSKGLTRLVFLGRMELVKGPDILIDALQSIKDLNFELHCMGDGSLLPRLKRCVSKLGLEGKVVFLGNINDPNVIYHELSRADWLVIPSRSDSIPLVFSESMKARLPVIVAEVGDMPELVRRYKVGLSFPKEDVKSLSKILEKVIKGGSQAGKRYYPRTDEVSDLFNVDSSAKKLLYMIERSKKE